MKKDCIKLIVTDLDGTLLRDDKSISDYTLSIFQQCKQHGIITAIATARGESNAEQYIKALNPDIIISGGGALIKIGGKEVYRCAFSKEETSKIIETALRLTDNQCEITVDTYDKHYWNYKNPLPNDWGETIYTDYSDFDAEALKICIETSDESIAEKTASSVNDCSYVKFSESDWYKFSKTSASKGEAVKRMALLTGMSTENIAVFGDDVTDIEMIRLCGIGAAVENAVEEVKIAADFIIGSNEKDGVAEFIEKSLLHK